MAENLNEELDSDGEDNNEEIDDLVTKISTELRNFKLKVGSEEKKTKRGRPPKSAQSVKQSAVGEEGLVKVLELLLDEITELKSEAKILGSCKRNIQRKLSILKLKINN